MVAAGTADLRRLDRNVAQWIATAVLRFADTERGDIQQLEGRFPPEWRVRVGDWRARFTFDPHSNTMTITRVLHRGRAYRG